MAGRSPPLLLQQEMIIKETVGAESEYGFVGTISLAEIKTVGGSVADGRRWGCGGPQSSNA